MLGKVKLLDTVNKARVMFARELIEMSLNDKFLDEILFENEHRELVTQSILYDWKRLWCKKCEQLGHGGTL